MSRTRLTQIHHRTILAAAARSARAVVVDRHQRLARRAAGAYLEAHVKLFLEAVDDRAEPPYEGEIARLSAMDLAAPDERLRRHVIRDLLESPALRTLAVGGLDPREGGGLLISAFSQGIRLNPAVYLAGGQP